MLYDSLKIFHILSATLLFTCVLYTYHLWRMIKNSYETSRAINRIQTLTAFIIVPVAILQLATGFTMISLKNYEFSSAWITSSIIGFIVIVGSWFSFIYFLVMSQQLITQIESTQLLEVKLKFFRRVQSILLLLCVGSLFSMIFFMANKV